MSNSILLVVKNNYNRNIFKVYFYDFIKRNMEDEISRILLDLPSLGESVLLFDDSLDVVEDQKYLSFESSFECGNLLQVFYGGLRNNFHHYYLFLEDDLGSNDAPSTNWFYFLVKNINTEFVYAFHICNMSKSSSCYTYGKKPVLLDGRDIPHSTDSWIEFGENICYHQTDSRILDEKGHYTLSFSTRFCQEAVYIAQSIPYSYSRLEDFLLELKSPLVRRRQLCQTQVGNKCDILYISSCPNTEESEKVWDQTFLLDEFVDEMKPVFVIMARIHSSETASSFVCEGIIRFLISENPMVRSILDTIDFLIIPMMNPDGVANGNFRNDSFGEDLGSSWYSPSFSRHPTVFFARKVLERLKFRELLVGCIDIHSHFSKCGSFFYGCRWRKALSIIELKAELEQFNSQIINSQDTISITSDGNSVCGNCNWEIDPRALVFAVAKRTQMLSLESCSFAINVHNMRTLRAFLSSELDVSLSLSLYISCFQGNQGRYDGKSFVLADYFR